MPSTEDEIPYKLYKPLKGSIFYLTDRVKEKYEGKIIKNCGTIRDSWTPRTKYVLCSKAEYYSFRSRIAGDVGDKVELPDKDFTAIEKAYKGSTKWVLNTGCLDAISDNSDGWTPIDWADSYEKEEPETRFDFWIQEMKTHGVHRLASLLDEAVEVNSEDNMKADYTRIATMIKDRPDELAILNNLKDKHGDLIAIIRDLQQVARTLVQDETPVQNDEGYESAE